MQKIRRQISTNKIEILSFGVVLFLVLIVTGFPYLKGGLSGHVPDLLYHLQRIEGVKDALLNKEYPVRIYSHFFYNYGYGSPMFYPDLFLIIPAILRIIGISPVWTWKIFALLITTIATLTTYLSFRYICKKWQWALCGTSLLMLSQFYLADLHDRVGLSEYIAYVFIPILVAGIYDFFEKEGKKTYLMGIAFVGLVLSHTIMTFIGIVVTIVFFLVMLFIPSKRRCILCKEKILCLLKTACCTVLLAAYYLLPMLEQIVYVDLKYSKPWAQIGQFTQPFYVFFNPLGYFNNIAYVGIGIPILLLIGCRFLFKKNNNIWADIFYFGGLLLFLITTKLFPWEYMNNTIFNMIQFTYRFYPYALCFLILGIVLILENNISNNCVKRTVVIIIFITVFFGGWQNYSMLSRWNNVGITTENLEERTTDVGRGEWLPISTGDKFLEVDLQGVFTQEVESGNNRYGFERGYNKGTFVISSSDQADYIVPLIFYKGYTSILQTSDGTQIELPVTESSNGLLKVHNDSGNIGTVMVMYVPTFIQCVSLYISLGTFIIIMLNKGRELWQKEKKETLSRF